jgi:hypothetical protein
MKIAVGDQVRVHFHPPYPMQSFCEGTVSRVDGSAPEGRFFVVDVTREVILDREHPIRRGFRDFVRYECPTDFSGRIEVLSTAAQDLGSEHVPLPMAAELPEQVAQEGTEPPPLELEVHAESEVELTSRADAASEPSQVDVEPQEARKRDGLIGRLFGRQK